MSKEVYIPVSISPESNEEDNPHNSEYNKDEIDKMKDKIDNLIIEKDNIYFKKDDGEYYPVAHPDLSTLPSILPQRFGNIQINEVLVPPILDYGKREFIRVKCRNFEIDATTDSEYYHNGEYYRDVYAQSNGTFTTSTNVIIENDYEITVRVLSDGVFLFYNGIRGEGSYYGRVFNAKDIALVEGSFVYIPLDKDGMVRLCYNDDSTDFFNVFCYDTVSNSIINCQDCSFLDGSCYRFTRKITKYDVLLQSNIDNALIKKITPKKNKLILKTNTSIVPSNAVVMEAYAFNDKESSPATTIKNNDGTITITPVKDIVPDFGLIRYYSNGNRDNYYYNYYDNKL